MVKKTILSILLFALLLLSPAVLAITRNIEINVKTFPNHDVFVNVAEPSDSYQLIKSLKKNSGDDGIAKVIFSTDGFSEVKIYVQVNKDGEKIMPVENFGIKSMFEPLYLQLIPGEIHEDYRELEPEINETEELNQTEETPIEENSTEELEELTPEETESGITGAIITDGSDWILSRTTMWIVGIVVIISTIVVFVARKAISGPTIDLPKVQNIKSLPSMPKPSSPLDDELSKTEQEIETVRGRIARIKKVKEAEKKLKAEEEELRELEKE